MDYNNMTDKEKLELLLQSIKPECLDAGSLKYWWSKQTLEWRFANSDFLEETRIACVALYKRFNKMGNIYDEVRTDKDAVQLLEEVDGFAIEDWVEPISGAAIDAFAKRSSTILALLSHEQVAWFEKIFAYWPEVEAAILDREFGIQMKKMLLGENGLRGDEK